MLRSALALLSSLQVGLRIKETVERSLRQAIVVAMAAIVLIAAALFGLFAAYQALVLSYGFTPPQAAGIIAAALALLGVLILATLPLLARKRKPQAATMLEAGGEGLGAIEQSIGKAMQQVSPVTLLAVAFIAGLLASRRR